VLVTVGRKPRLDGWGLEEVALRVEHGGVHINDRCETSMRGVYAIGDVTGEPMLAHRAMAQGELVAEIVAGRRSRWHRRSVPSVCFTDPEIVSVGVSVQQAHEEGLEVKSGQFPFQANGRAMSTGQESGMVRVIARADNHEIAGIQAVGHDISELSSAFSLAIEMGARLEDLMGTIHAHPTRSEALQEAAFAAVGKPIHI